AIADTRFAHSILRKVRSACKADLLQSCCASVRVVQLNARKLREISARTAVEIAALLKPSWSRLFQPTLPHEGRGARPVNHRAWLSGFQSTPAHGGRQGWRDCGSLTATNVNPRCTGCDTPDPQHGDGRVSST